MLNDPDNLSIRMGFRTSGEPGRQDGDQLRRLECLRALRLGLRDAAARHHLPNSALGGSQHRCRSPDHGSVRRDGGHLRRRRSPSTTPGRAGSPATAQLLQYAPVRRIEASPGTTAPAVRSVASSTSANRIHVQFHPQREDSAPSSPPHEFPGSVARSHQYSGSATAPGRHERRENSRNADAPQHHRSHPRRHLFAPQEDSLRYCLRCHPPSVCTSPTPASIASRFMTSSSRNSCFPRSKWASFPARSR